MGVTGKTKVTGLFGWPVEHSLSPAMHNAAFSTLGLDYTYVPFAVAPPELGQAVASVRALGLAGVNVTIPHKVAVMSYLDELSPSAQAIGAVNTIVNREGRLIGYNTDGEGFIRSLREQGIEVQGKQAVLLGAGGAARAVVVGLLEAGCTSVFIAARTGSKAADLAKSFQAQRVTGECWSDAVAQMALQTCDLLINATPLGMIPHYQDMPPVDWHHLNPQAIVCDLVYNPLLTNLLQEAQKYGHKVVTGEGMLAGQGALSFSMWTNREAPYDVMLATIRQQLK